MKIIGFIIVILSLLNIGFIFLIRKNVTNVDDKIKYLTWSYNFSKVLFAIAIIGNLIKMFF